MRSFRIWSRISSTLKARDLTKTALASIPGGVTYERLRNSNARTAELDALLGRLSGHALFRAEGNHDRKRFPSSGEMVRPRLPLPGTLETQPLVVDGIMYANGARNRVRARRKDRPPDLELYTPAEGAKSERDQSVQSRRRRARQSRLRGYARCRAGRARRENGPSSSGKHRWPTPCWATPSRAHRSS